MIFPNLASKPRLNTRPVWLLTLAAGAVALILAAVNIQLYVATSRDLSEQIALREELQTSRDKVAGAFKEHLAVLDRVPWKGLGGRIEAVNKVLAEHQFSWTRLLEDLGEVLPWQVRVVSVSPTVKDGVVTLSMNAVSQDRDGFLELLDNMVNDSRFVDPVPSRETWPEAGDVVGYSFSMRVQYVAGGVQDDGEVAE